VTDPTLPGFLRFNVDKAATEAATKSKKARREKDLADEEAKRGKQAAIDNILRMGVSREEEKKMSGTEKLLVTMEVEILDDEEFKQFTQIGVALTDTKQVEFKLFECIAIRMGNAFFPKYGYRYSNSTADIFAKN